MKTLYLICGAPGSGKSYLAEAAAEELNKEGIKTNIVSRDKIRNVLLDEGDEYLSKENKVWTQFINAAKASLHDYDCTILDGMHLDVAARCKVIKALEGELEDINVYALWRNTPLEICVANNKFKDDGQPVSDAMLRALYEKFVPPTREEGFDAILTFEEK